MIRRMTENFNQILQVFGKREEQKILSALMDYAKGASCDYAKNLKENNIT